MRLESNVAPSVLAVSESWITESSNLTEERQDIVFKRCDVPKRMASDLVGLSAMPFSLKPDMNGAKSGTYLTFEQIYCVHICRF